MLQGQLLDGGVGLCYRVSYLMEVLVCVTGSVTGWRCCLCYRVSYWMEVLVCVTGSVTGWRCWFVLQGQLFDGGVGLCYRVSYWMAVLVCVTGSVT